MTNPATPHPAPPDLSRDYANGAFIAGANDFPPRWQADAAALRMALGARARLDLRYGPAERQVLDLFLPDAPPKGLMVFVHGGYWMETDHKMWSHLAAGALARGFACALPTYTLAPEARIAQITTQIARAVTFAAEQVPGPVVVTGHSAGGHLAARMGCADQTGVVADRVARVVPISPLADLAPLMQTDMNATLHLDAAEARAESPALRPLRSAAHVWVGGQERPAFLWQARLLSEAWSCPWTVDPGKHHFDVIDGLTDPNSALVETCLGGLAG